MSGSLRFGVFVEVVILGSDDVSKLVSRWVRRESPLDDLKKLFLRVVNGTDVGRVKVF